MILLAATTDKLQLVSSSTSSLDVLASFLDMSNADPPVVKGSTASRQLTAITTATTTDILAAPGASTVRNLKTLTVRNKGAADNSVTLIYDANGTDYEIHKVTLKTGECLEYIDGVGFYVLAATGKLFKNLRVSADSVHATAATFADVTGLQAAVEAGKHYNFEAHLFHVSNATTTGAQFAIGGVAMTAMRISIIDTVTGSATAAALSAPVADITAINTAASVQTTGSANVTMGILSGWFNPSASGTWSVRATSEVTVANGLTVKQGSWCHVWEADN